MQRAPFLAPFLFLALACESSPMSGESAHESSKAAASDILPFKATETELANGLKVIVVPTGFPNLVSVQIPVQTGSRNEVEAGKTGFAHFFEHMMFRGTKQYPPEVYNEIITRAGARQNAYTTDDYTNYHVTFAKEDLPKILEIEADRFQHLDYSEEGFRTEALAVLGEYNKNFANPENKLDEVQHERAYTVHPYKHTTMGFLADIQAMPDQMEYARTFFQRWYRPENTTIIVAGDVKPDEVLPLVEKYWSGWKRGDFKAQIPVEPTPKKPVYAHVTWESETLPIVTVAFHGPAFSDSEPDAAALDLALELAFGETSPLYKRLVIDEQKLNSLGYNSSNSADPSLATIYAELKNPEVDAVAVRDAILATVAGMKAAEPDAKRLAEAKSNMRYSFARLLDSTDRIASILARYVRYQRSYGTLNNLFRNYDRLTPADLLASTRKYMTDERMVVATLSFQPLPPAIGELPTLASFAPASVSSADDVEFLFSRSPNTQLSMKFLFDAGSSDDPPGKEGLASLAAAMIAEAGSRDLRYDEIQKALFPIAGSFRAQVDREMTVFSGSIHKDNLERFAATALKQLTAPGFREEDFTRLKEGLKNELVQDLRTNNDEELGKELLQASLFAGTPYGHPTQGTVAGIESLTLDDVREFIAANYTRARLVVGLAGDVPEAFVGRLRGELGVLPRGEKRAAEPAPKAKAVQGIQVEIVAKETLATAISLGFPIEVTRSHPDFVALYLARTWLGEHRSSMSHLYQRIREVRGMNYGDYAYIEAFPRGMFQFFPDANRGRRAQLFEIWIRPVKPENAQHALRIAIHELDQLVSKGLSREDFESTREYLSKNVFLLTATQDAQLGYALDSRFYGIPEYTKFMRDGLAKLTLEQVNAALKKHLQAKNMRVVCVTKDAQGLAQTLLSDAPSKITYDAAKPKELLDEDALIGARKLSLDVLVTPVADVFAH